jgi:hypothetical protein
MGSESQKTQRSPQIFKPVSFCKAFYADHFDETFFLLSSANDDARVNILEGVRLLKGVGAI